MLRELKASQGVDVEYRRNMRVFNVNPQTEPQFYNDAIAMRLNIKLGIREDDPNRFTRADIIKRANYERMAKPGGKSHSFVQHLR